MDPARRASAREDLEQLFQGRARGFAARRASATTSARHTRVLVALDLGERFAIELAALSAISVADTIRSVPLAPSGVRGVCVHEGELVSVVELAAVLGRACDERRGSGFILFPRGRSAESGLFVDDVLSAEDLDFGELPKSPRVDGLVRTVTADGVQVLDSRVLWLHEKLARPTSRADRSPHLEPKSPS